MTELTWLKSGEPSELLQQVRAIATPRQLRLFACATAREIWPFLLDERSQRAIEIAERFADNLASREELLQAQQEAFEVARLASLRDVVSDPGWAASRLAARVANGDAFSAATGVTYLARLCFAPWTWNPEGRIIGRGDEQTKQELRQRQCQLLHEIFGNVYRPVGLEPSWLQVHDAAVIRLAQDIYSQQRWQELPILSDALEEAGCTEQTVLEHCRQATRHVRGCWVVDLILGSARGISS